MAGFLANIVTCYRWLQHMVARAGLREGSRLPGAAPDAAHSVIKSASAPAWPMRCDPSRLARVVAKSQYAPA